MTPGELFYLAIVIATFGGFGLWVGYVTWRFDRSRAGRPEARRYQEAPGGAHATAD